MKRFLGAALLPRRPGILGGFRNRDSPLSYINDSSFATWISDTWTSTQDQIYWGRKGSGPTGKCGGREEGRGKAEQELATGWVRSSRQHPPSGSNRGDVELYLPAGIGREQGAGSLFVGETHHLSSHWRPASQVQLTNPNPNNDGPRVWRLASLKPSRPVAFNAGHTRGCGAELTVLDKRQRGRYLLFWASLASVWKQSDPRGRSTCPWLCPVWSCAPPPTPSNMIFICF